MTSTPEQVIGRLKSVGWDKVWLPQTGPEDLETVPLNFSDMAPGVVGEWASKCTAWLSYALMQEGMANTHAKELKRQFARQVNRAIVTHELKQRTYDLQVAAAVEEDRQLAELQDEIAHWEGAEHMWSRAQEAYKAYTQLCRDDMYRRTREQS